MALWGRYERNGTSGFGVIEGDSIAVHEGDMFDGATPTGDTVSLNDVKLLAPCTPTKMVAMWNNFHALAAKMEVAEPEEPLFFLKGNNSFLGPDETVRRPVSYDGKVVYEGELGIVIGKTCKNVPESRAYDVIAGYTIMLDITARDIVRIEKKEGHQLLGKMFDSFAPQGPWMVTPDEIGDPMNLAIRAHVNGEIRQDGNTNQMIFPIPKLIAYLSQMTLDAGDIILTGTPSGVAMGRKPDPEPFFMQPGDVLETEIEGIGKMRHEITEDNNPERSWQW